MANISTFFGSFTFDTQDKAWTPDGVLLAHNVLNKFSACGGGYGICIDEFIFESPASLLESFLSWGVTESYPMSLGYWGNGRWSAQGTLENFDNWTQPHLGPLEDLSYKNKRDKLIQLMYENGWFFSLDFTDEEGGIGFIQEGTATIQPRIDEDGYSFYVETNCDVEYDHNLYYYSRIIEQEPDGDSEMLYDVVYNIIHTLKEHNYFKGAVPNKYNDNNRKLLKDLKEKFEPTKEEIEAMSEFILSKELDKLLVAWGSSYEDYDSIPEELIEYYKDKGTE